MEHIDIDFEKTVSDEQRAEAVSELISMPPPPGVFGSFGGGRVKRHLGIMIPLLSIHLLLNSKPTLVEYMTPLEVIEI